ncbi:MAG: DegT/DnrJ/EryC1/StrS family aminotransferase [Candidatus Pelagibacter sp.]
MILKNKFDHRLLLPKKNKYIYPLLDKGLSKKDLNEGVKVLNSGRITMGKKTEEFEKKFKNYLGVKYALMVNSGSSANLLSAFASCNPLRKNRFKKGDEAIIQSLCWPTSLWPLVQCGLKINFVDINPSTLNVNAKEIIKKVSKKTKVILIINVLGLSPDIKKIRDFCKKKKIILIEDNCESLGAKFKNKYLGTYGDFGTFSFFYSHQITAGEGGMVICKDKRDYEILKSLRSHGWSREKKTAIKNPHLDPRYIFTNTGFNLRPTDIQAAIGLSQFKRLKKFIKIRIRNRDKIINSLKKHTKWSDQFSFVSLSKKISPSYMVFPIFLNDRYKNKKRYFVNYIESKGLETRPIISGSFVKQPSSKLFKLNSKNKKYPGADKVQNLGFVIGLHTKDISKKELKFLSDTLLSIDGL